VGIRPDGTRHRVGKNTGDHPGIAGAGDRGVRQASIVPQVQFDIVSTPQTRRGANWTVSMNAIPPNAIWEVSELVADIQDAYILAA